MLRRIPVLPTLVVLIAVAIMVRLGFWQLDRLAQKEALLARYAAAQKNPDPLFGLPIRDDGETSYRRIQIYCDQPRDWRSASGRNDRGESGWAHSVVCTTGGNAPDTPSELRLPDVVLIPVTVVLGWSRTPDLVRWPGGHLQGIVIAEARLKYRVVADPPLAGLEANAKPDPRDIPNNHFAYAIQWFLFALTALVIYALALRKRLAATDPPS